MSETELLSMHSNLLLILFQVARLLQIPSVEKICKKFVTHKMNVENIIGELASMLPALNLPA